MTKVICFDLEGPLSPQDNAYDVLGLVERGHEVFEVLSKYDDILTLEEREGYEPGDTLSLIVPFLLHHGITEADIKKVSDKAPLVPGVKYTLDSLKAAGWEPYIISTSYQQHAYNIAAQLGVPEERVYCTRMPLDRFREGLKESDSKLVADVEKDILEDLYPNIKDEDGIKKRLDRFFREDLQGTALGAVMKEVSVVGGQRKVDSVYDISKKTGALLSEMFAVGDSITDYKMLREVEEKGGVSVAFNGNKYSIPYATVGLAANDMRFLLILTSAYARDGKAEVEKAVREWEEKTAEFLENPRQIPSKRITEDVRDFLFENRAPKIYGPFFSYLAGSGEEKHIEAIRKHKTARSIVRGAAAKLG